MNSFIFSSHNILICTLFFTIEVCVYNFIFFINTFYLLFGGVLSFAINISISIIPSFLYILH